MFIILGGARSPHYHRAETRRTLKRELSSSLSTVDVLPYGPDALQQAWYLEKTGLCPAYRNTETTYYPTGTAFFPDLLEELEQARDYIFLEYFILAEGSMWSEMLDILTRKAAQGVDVRVIYDGVGSATTLPPDYPDQLHRLGILCRVFQPLRPLLSIHQNNRDHRKLCVIDGVTGFVSGLNLADEYVDRKERFGYWKDNALRLRGEAAWSLTVFFLTMWDHQNPSSDYRLFRPGTLPPLAETGGLVAPYADTPNPADTVCADLHLQMITKAKRYLYVTTPYLTPDETILSALCLAARSGVDVRIMTPTSPTKRWSLRSPAPTTRPCWRRGRGSMSSPPASSTARRWWPTTCMPRWAAATWTIAASTCSLRTASGCAATRRCWRCGTTFCTPWRSARRSP